MVLRGVFFFPLFKEFRGVAKATFVSVCTSGIDNQNLEVPKVRE